LFPLTSNFEGDFVLQLVPVDTENTMDEWPPPPPCIRSGAACAPAPATSCACAARAPSSAAHLKVADAGLKPTETVEIIWQAGRLRSKSMSFTKVCTVDDVWEGEMAPFTVDGHEICWWAPKAARSRPSRASARTRTSPSRRASSTARS
jgi:toluene monooxygenase system protein B